MAGNARKHVTSIKNSLRFSYLLIIALLIIPTVYSIIIFRLHANQYDRIITNVSHANQLSQVARGGLVDEVWNVVAGLKSFNEGSQYIMLREIRVGLSDIMKSCSVENREFLEVASRTEKTLEKYVERLGNQIAANASVAENQEVMEQVRGVSSLLSDILQDFIVSEMEVAEQTNENIHRASFNLTLVQIGIAVLCFLIAMGVSSVLSRIIRKPIRSMELLSTRIASGDLSARAAHPHVVELDQLAENLNIMAGRIQELIDENVKEQRSKQIAEMRTLQAQITPHFLYNTFDTIIWLAESEQMDEVISITRAFSTYFRISLSKGHDWISVAQEINHVKNYLLIQQIRYANILSYEIRVGEGLENVPILKLLLQPLVENAIYHGIKNKRGRGKIIVEAELVDAFGKKDGGVRLCVTDDGIGFTTEHLQEVLGELRHKTDTENLTVVYGLYNVNKRLSLYYDGTVSLDIQSEYGKGTSVCFTVPVFPIVSQFQKPC